MHYNISCYQCFGDIGDEEQITDADMISAVSFDPTGEYLATGDRGGRIVLFQKDSSQKNISLFNVFGEFQSHEPEFDYLKSLEIEERINQIKWCPQLYNSLFLLSTNDKTIKLWKIQNRRAVEAPPTRFINDKSHISLPSISKNVSNFTAVPKRIFGNAHTYHINSVSVNSDGETFISTDDLRINLWNMDINNNAFNIVDMKPESLEELNEVITCSEFHPSHCHILAFSSSKGIIRLGDLRASALCDQAKCMPPGEPSVTNLFREMVSSISDFKFSSCGRYIFARDYLSVKVWDTHMESSPVATYKVGNHLSEHLHSLFEKEFIFDKFQVSVSSNGRQFISGNYQEVFHISDRTTQGVSSFCLTKPGEYSSQYTFSRTSVHEMNFSKKVQALCWHPQENLFALAGANKLFIYCLQNSQRQIL